MPTDRSRLKATALCGLLALSIPLGQLGLRYTSGNVHEVEAGTLYRSGQLDGPDLRMLVADKGIKTILNLRGAHPNQDWYRQEAVVARKAGVDYRSVSISARAVPNMSTMVEIARILQEVPRPILVHCMGGSDRSGLASAIHEFVVEGASEREAADQLSIVYGRFPWLGSRTAAMDRAFAEFADYWRDERRQLVASE